MEISDLVEKFVLNKENSSILVDLTKLSTEYYSKFVSNQDYSHILVEIKDYLVKHSEFKEIDPKKFSVELMKYLYVNRKK